MSGKIKKPGSKKEQQIENKLWEQKKKKQLAKRTPKQTEENQKPYTTPLPGAPVGHNIARKRQGPPPVNI